MSMTEREILENNYKNAVLWVNYFKREFEKGLSDKSYCDEADKRLWDAKAMLDDYNKKMKLIAYTRISFKSPKKDTYKLLFKDNEGKYFNYRFSEALFSMRDLKIGCEYELLFSRFDKQKIIDFREVL